MLERNPGPLGKLAHTLSLVSPSLSLFFSKVRVRSSGQARSGQVRSAPVGARYFVGTDAGDERIVARLAADTVILYQ